MNFLDFKNKMFDLGCFNIYQIKVFYPLFDRTNITRWVNNGYLIRLRGGYYTFSEYKQKAGYEFYFANKIYSPSYISLYSALSFYELIPENIVQITSVSSLKTTEFENPFGTFSYRKVKDNLMFGYIPKKIIGGKTILVASMEKALLDLLYLYPFYNTEQELLSLRLDEDILQESLNKNDFISLCDKFNSKALSLRVKKLLKTYDL